MNEKILPIIAIAISTIAIAFSVIRKPDGGARQQGEGEYEQRLRQLEAQIAQLSRGGEPKKLGSGCKALFSTGSGFMQNPVNVTDILFFQMFVHLGKAHLLSEPLAVSIYNNLIATKRGENGTKKASNPLGTIMASYARGLLGINHLALITLVDDKQAFIDSVFVGGAAKLMEIAKDKMMVNFLLKEQSPHVDLTNRGFSQSDLKNKEFGYAYYSTQLYDLINGYMNNVVGHVYKSDADVKNDTDLKNMKD